MGYCNSWEHAVRTPGLGVNPPGTTSPGAGITSGKHIPGITSGNKLALNYFPGVTLCLE